MGKRLFTPSPPNKWQYNAMAGGRYSEKYGYILGYYKAAETLVASAPQNRTNDFLFFPICFNYRHYVELSLKHLIIATERFHSALEELGEARGKLKKSAESEIINEHSLARLFGLLIERLELVTDEQFDDNIRKVLMQLHGMDPNGQIFRYPFRKKNGQLELALPDQRLYDLENIRKNMEEVYNYLSGIDAWLDYNTYLALDLIHEMQEQMGW